MSSPMRRGRARRAARGPGARPRIRRSAASQFSIAPRAAATGVFRSWASCGEQRRLHLLARLRLLGRAREAQEPLALDGEAEQQRAAPPPCARSTAGRARRARPRAGGRRESEGRCRCRRAPTGRRRSCPAGRRARRCPRGTACPGVDAASASCPFSSASRTPPARTGGPGAGGPPRRRGATRGWCRRGSPGRAASARSGRGARPRRSPRRRRESAERRPIRSPETRKTKRAATLRGSWIVNV